MRSPIEALVTEKALHFLSIRRNADLADVIANDPQFSSEIKNVCAKVSVHISDEIDEITSLLGVSKRRFIETAFLDALARSRQVMEAEGVFDALDDGLIIEAVEGEQ